MCTRKTRSSSRSTYCRMKGTSMPDKTQPGQNPPDNKASQKSAAKGAMPSGTPPKGRAAQSGAAGEARPRDLTHEEMAMTASTAASDAVPTMTPPQQTQGGASAGGI